MPLNSVKSHCRIVAVLLGLPLLLASCQFGRSLIYNVADIKDHRKFPARELVADAEPFQFFETDSGRAPKAINQVPFEDFLKRSKTVAFLIIQRDTIQYEQYFRGYDKAGIVPSFSMAKSVTSILIGCAIDEGLIQSVNEPVTNYISELKDAGYDRVTIEHLLQMTSGMKYNESYASPFGDAAAYYYGLNLRKLIGKLKLNVEPGTEFKYTSGSTQLLGLILERVLPNKTVTQYLQEKIWTPLGMEYDASWSIDSKKSGLEKTFCCLNARARDFAKIGRLYLNQGNWNGEQIVSEDWVAASTKLDSTAGSVPYYQYQWWQPTPGQDFMAEGVLGQFVYVHPEKELIIVRLGKKHSKQSWWSIFPALAEVY